MPKMNSNCRTAFNSYYQINYNYSAIMGHRADFMLI